MHIRHLFAGLAAGLLCTLSAQATDTAFWKPYAVDDKTYALLAFDGDQPLAGTGVAVTGEGALAGGAQLTPEGKFGGGLRLNGTGHAAFPALPFAPGKMAIHHANQTLSIEAWIKLDRLPEAGSTATIAHRDGPGAVGFTLFVDADGALTLRLKPAGGRETVFRSEAGAVPVGEWAHVAGVGAGGHLSIGRDTLYVNGVEVFNGPATGAVGGAADTTPADLLVGGTPGGNGFTGWIDEVRLHSQVGKLWAPEAMPWIARIAEKGMPPLAEALAPGRGPTLTFPLDGNLRPVASPAVHERDPALVDRFKVGFKGEYVPGVKGTAARGRLDISGCALADLKEGSLEIWTRPYGVNSVSDRGCGVFESSAFIAYFHNSVNANRKLSFYYKDAKGNLRMQSDALGTEIHPGRWYHLVFAWDADRIVMYVDGQAAASGANSLTTEGNKGLLNRLVFNTYGTRYDIDEVAVYEHRLTGAEVSNRYWSYVAPEKMTAAKTPAPIRLEAWRFPSENAISYRMTPGAGLEGVAKATLRLQDEKGKEILVAERAFTEEVGRLEAPPLAEGRYILDAAVTLGGKELRSEPISFLARKLPWEGNALGVTDEVFPPFTPVKVDGDTVSVVSRGYRMNGFGLWDSVVSQGRELLAAPVRLRYETADGKEGAWTFGKGFFESAKPHLARHRAEAVSEAVSVETVSEIEMDGMMKVTLTLKPAEKGAGVRVQGSGGEKVSGVSVQVSPTPDTRNLTPETSSQPDTRTPNPAPSLTRLWLEIPLKASEATLMHEDTGTLRRNYSGRIPPGEGVVWASKRKNGWRNAFTGYVWIGGEERGVAWFAENDKGWITEKNESGKPLQEIVREGDRVVIRVNLVNNPAAITAPRRMVFGLQASPAKPMPEDWRTGARGGGLPVEPWGGHQCADKFPFEDRWEIVDKIIERQTTGKNNGEWFKAYQQEHNIPPLRGTQPWLQSVGHFAWHPVYSGRNRPVLTYFEEMAVSTYRPEWHVYKDEWSTGLLDPRQSWPDGYDIFRQGKLAGAAIRVNFGPSYRDYGAWYANEWLKRGVGIYWDNTFLTTASNPLTSEAYLAEDGQIQPATTLWNQREYSRRVWNLMQRWMRERKEKLLFLQHMTNTALLPILAWTSTAFDNEFEPASYAQGVSYPYQNDPKEPFPPDYIRAQSLGRQFGCYPALCFQLFQVKDLDLNLIPAREREGGVYQHKRNWGMARVHEIPGGDFPSERFEKALRGFGYGTDDVVVHNYWAEKPALKVDDATVKWLVVARPADKRLFVILQSWSRQPGKIKASFDYDAIGFRPRGMVVNLETGAVAGAADTGAFELTQTAPYDMQVLGVGLPPPPDGVRFADDFADAPSPRWSNVSAFFKTLPEKTGGRVLRMAANDAPWAGPGRIELWDGVEGWQDGTLEIGFRPSTVPKERAGLFVVVTRAGQPVWSQHGLAHTRLSNGQFMTVFANPVKNCFEIERWTIGADGARGKTTTTRLGPLGDGAHTLAIAMNGLNTKVLFDGAEAAAFADTPGQDAAFGIHAGQALSESFAIDLTRVVMKNSSPAK